MTTQDPGAYYGLKTKLCIGMEVHVELNTRTKVWTSAPNLAHPDYFEAEPNSLLDPIVVGMPGTLPVLNREALRKSILVGLAMNCEIATRTQWDRKSYFYPDLPKSYQISQFDKPVCGPGIFEYPMPDGSTAKVGITRAHLEEDAGKLLHEAPGGGTIDFSIIDLNRAGTPLLEIVTDPDMTSAEEAIAYSKALWLLVRHLGISEGIMQRGHMRFEPNINVIIEKDGQTYKTPISEIKNLNSFSAVEGAICHEHVRQIEQWLKDGVVMGARTKQTRGWDDVKAETIPQRIKEDADEYRYFPDPDLVEIDISSEEVDALRASLPPTPTALRNDWIAKNVSPVDADALLSEPTDTAFFLQVLEAGADAKAASKLLRNAAAKVANAREVQIAALGVSAQQCVQLLSLLVGGKVSSNATEKLLAAASKIDANMEDIAKQQGALQVNDSSALQGYVDEVLANPGMTKAIEDIRAGKDKAIGSLMGQVMKLSKGQANPGVVRRMILDALKD